MESGSPAGGDIPMSLGSPRRGSSSDRKLPAKHLPDAVLQRLPDGGLPSQQARKRRKHQEPINLTGDPEVDRNESSESSTDDDDEPSFEIGPPPGLSPLAEEVSVKAIVQRDRHGYGQ